MLPPGVLHSLRHGVDVVEFQTPTYERLIAMASQKVLTQPHWDTRKALAAATMGTYQHPTLRAEREEPGVTVERIVEFPQFCVDRLRLEPGASRSAHTRARGGYHLLFGLSGGGALRMPRGDETPLIKRTALFLGASAGEYEIRAREDGPLTYLCARPVLGS